MNSFFAILKKESLLLLKDKMGMAFIILMPVILVILMTSIQDSTYKSFSNNKINILIINDDKDIIGNAIISGLDSTGIFNVYWQNGDKKFNKNYIKENINNDIFKVGIYIPKNLTKNIKKYFYKQVNNQMPTTQVNKNIKLNLSELNIYYNPILKQDFRISIKSAVNNIIAEVKVNIIYKTYTKALSTITRKKNNNNLPRTLISIKENSTSEKSEVLPTSTQHNVPAWTVFAIFFIVIPLSTNFIYEKQSGTFLRLKTIQTPFIYHIVGKILVFTLMSIVQAFIILLIGKYFFPLIDLPVLILNKVLLFFIFTIFIGIASSSYAVAIGTIAKTQHQASIFGSISVVIFAAFGGIWVPVFVMSSFMQKVSSFSPLNWALQGYYKIILSNLNFNDLLPEIYKLMSFSAILIIISILLQKKIFSD